MRKYILIENDVFFISQRLKEIDKSYFIVWNCEKSKFEVHALGQIGGTFCFTLPFDRLDARAIEYTLKTRSQNLTRLIEEIDAQNLKLQKDNFKKAVNKLEEVLL